MFYYALECLCPVSLMLQLLWLTSWQWTALTIKLLQQHSSIRPRDALTSCMANMLQMAMMFVYGQQVCKMNFILDLIINRGKMSATACTCINQVEIRLRLCMQHLLQMNCDTARVRERDSYDTIHSSCQLCQRLQLWLLWQLLIYFVFHMNAMRKEQRNAWK